MGQLERAVRCVSHWQILSIILGNTKTTGDRENNLGNLKRKEKKERSCGETVNLVRVWAQPGLGRAYADNEHS